MPFPRLNWTLKFIPLGLFWGLIAGGFHTYHIADMGSVDDQVSWIVPVVTVLGTCLIATPLARVLLTRELSSKRWILNWLITAVASCVGGIAIFYTTLFFLAGLQPTYLYSSPSPANLFASLSIAMLMGMGFSLIFGILIGIECAVVALVLAPFSLIARRLILRRRLPSRPGLTQRKPA